jgi:hypothetical protein
MGHLGNAEISGSQSMSPNQQHQQYPESVRDANLSGVLQVIHMKA